MLESLLASTESMEGLVVVFSSPSEGPGRGDRTFSAPIVACAMKGNSY